MFYFTDPAQPGQINRGLSDFTAPNVSLHWSASTGLVENYFIQVDGQSFNTTDNKTEIILTGMEPGRTYQVKFTAASNSRNSSERDDSFTTDSEREYLHPLQPMS